MEFPQNLYPVVDDNSKSPLSYLLQDPSFLNPASSTLLDPSNQQTVPLPQSTTTATTTANATNIPDFDDSVMWEDELPLPSDLASLDAGALSKVRRRKRQPKNCSFCRRRKLKCDREHPCSNCVKRNIESTCTYANEPNEHESHRTSDLSTSISPTNLVNTEAYNLNSIPRIPPKDLKQPRLISRKAVKFSDFNPAQQEDPTQASELKKRLDKMEMLVLSMLQEKHSTEGSLSSNSTPESEDKNSSPLESSRHTSTTSSASFNSSTPSSAANARKHLTKARDSLGMLKLAKSGNSIYHGDTHWQGLFSEIEQLEDLICNLSLKHKTQATANAATGIRMPVNEKEDLAPFPFMSAGGSKMNPLDVLATIPSKAVCDTLIQRYFDIFESCFCLVHQPVFEKEYAEFWANPTSTELIWVSVFLGMLVLALQSYSAETVPESFRGNPRKAWLVWMEGMEVCATQGRILFKPALNNVRSALLWIMAQANYQSKWEWVDTCATSISMVIRMAQSMGLHRDPTWFAMSLYEAEQRRRIWAVVQYLDLHASVIQGLPCIISHFGTDVEPPANLNKNDISPDMAKMPQELPLTTRTAASFTIMRARMVRWLAKVLEDSAGIGPDAVKVSFEQVLELHHNIRTTFTDAPEYLSKSVLKGSNANCPPDLLVQRLWYEIDYLRTLHALHRYYGALGMADVKYRRSREESLYASVRLLQLQEWCFKSEEGIQMRQLFDWVCHNFLLSHFFHATVYVSLALIDHFDTFSVDQRLEQIRLVTLSRSIFVESLAYSGRFEALCTLLCILVDKVHAISKMTVKERAEILRQKEVRKQNFAYNSTFNAPSQPLNKGMTMNLDATDSTISFEYFSSLTPGAFTSLNTPDTPRAWFQEIAEGGFKSMDSMQNGNGIDNGNGNGIGGIGDMDLSQLNSYYQVQQF